MRNGSSTPPPDGVFVLRAFHGELPVATEARMDSEIRLLNAAIGPSRQLMLRSGPVPPDRESLAGVRVVHEPCGSVWELARTLRRRFAELRPRFVHCHGPHAALAAGLARLLGRSRGVCVVYEIHGASAFESLYRHRERPSRWLRFGALYLLESLAIVLADRVVLVSDEIARYYPVARLKRRLAIPRLVDTAGGEGDGGPPDGLAALEEFARRARERGRRIAVYSGGVAEWQLTRETVRLMAALVEGGGFAAAVFTPFPDEFERVLDEEGIERGEHWFVGAFDRAAVPRALERCDLGVILRDDVVLNRVASPTKLYEYLHAGLAVLTTTGVPEGRRIVETTGAGVVVAPERLRDPEGLAAEIAPRLRAADAARPALRRQRERFTWEAGRRELFAVYGLG